MAARFQYNPKNNRWEKPSTTSGDNPPTGFSPVPGSTYVDTVTGEKKQVLGQGSPDRVVSAQTPTTTAAPKAQTTPKPTNQRTRVTSPKPSFNPNVKITKPTNQPTNVTPKPDTTIADAVAAALAGGGVDSGLLKLLLGGGGGGGTAQPTTKQRIATAKNVGRKNLALARKFYGQQQQQGQQAIDAATAELMANLQAPTAYTDVPLVSVPPALQGLQQNLLAYGGTGQEAAAQAGVDQQAADMYAALARRGAQQMGQAETGYFNALKNAALQAQTAGRQGLTQTTNDLLGQVMLQNLQAIINAQQ